MIDNTFQVVPFYTSLAEQNHRKPYAFGAVYPNIWPTDYLPPFQLQLKRNAENPKSVVFAKAELYDLNDKLIKDITDYVNDWYDESISNDGKYRYFSFWDSGHELLAPEGFAYIRLEGSEGDIYYSEVLCFCSDSSNYIRLDFYDDNNFDTISKGTLWYSLNYQNTIYIDATIGKPEYDLEEEGEERDGFFFAEKQISKKTYRFSFVAPEYLCDILRIAPLSETVTVYYKGKHYAVDQILVSTDWGEQGDLATVEIEFTSDSIIKKLGTIQ